MVKLPNSGISLFVERRGEGPPLYAIHGGPGLDHTTLLGGLERLEEFFEIHYIDLRGHGRSSRCADGEYSLFRFAQDIEELRVALGHERITLLGHSMGAKVALLYAQENPRRLDALLLISISPAPPRYASRFLKAKGRFFARITLVFWALWTAFRQLIGVPWNLEESYRFFWAYCWRLYARRREPLRDLRSILLNSLVPPLSVVQPITVEMSVLDLTRVLENISVRTLAVCGEEDVLFRKEQHLLRGLPNAEFRFIPNAGHFPHLERPDAFGEVLRNFLVPPDTALERRAQS